MPSSSNGIVSEPRRAAFPTAAAYRRAVVRWMEGLAYEESLRQRLRWIRRNCGPSEVS